MYVVSLLLLVKIPVNNLVELDRVNMFVCVRVFVCTEDFNKVNILCLEIIMVVISICALNCRTCQYNGLCVKPNIHSSVNKE